MSSSTNNFYAVLPHLSFFNMIYELSVAGGVKDYVDVYYKLHFKRLRADILGLLDREEVCIF